MTALVCFDGRSTHPLRWLLHREFRHCFACVDDGLYWILVDGRDGLPAIKVAASSDFDLAAYYRARGYAVIETAGGPGIRGPLVTANCVGLVKAALGIRAPLVITPFQLFNHLRKR